MSLRFAFEQFADLRRDAQLLTERVVVMDVSMAVLDGLEATRLIKACAATRDARVIAYTGNPAFEESPTRMLFAAVSAPVCRAPVPCGHENGLGCVTDLL